ncbi:hypothetical protein [Hymenobacter sp. BRD67]|uniref:hypothetical protein n=1 Tax=Hymenobacter sp. BRD67 TaxID=2675877 RepID=UPI001567032E|nr:hypothetical protein [Hymenobacter sp. BRD67]QKG51374.1 hypothetical protein GKZ67_00720 [Hymenobacter sp. BRD67]
MAVLLLAAQPGYCQSPQWQWAVQAAGSGTSQLKGVATDKEGNTYAIGFFTEKTDFEPISLTSQGKSDLFVAKLSPAGSWEWAIAAGSSGSDQGAGIALDASGAIFVTGSFSNQVTLGATTLTSQGATDVFVAQIGTDGQWLWATSAGGPGLDLARALATTGTGALVVAGQFAATAAFGPKTLTSNGISDAFVASLTPAGGWQWATAAGSEGNDEARALAVSGKGDIYVTGYFSALVAFGATTLRGRGLNDAFVGKLSSTGQWQWATAATGTNTAYGKGLAADPAGGVFVTGSFSGDAFFGPIHLCGDNDDGFVGRLSANGRWDWVKSISSPFLESIVGIALDKKGKLYVAGTFSDQIKAGGFQLVSHGHTDAFVGYLSRAGNWLGLTAAGGADDDDAQAMALAAGGEVYIGGEFSSEATFGSSQLQAAQPYTQLYVGRASVLPSAPQP